MVIHNGLNRERFGAALKKWPRETARELLKISPAEQIVLIMGTVCERKGQIDLVEAIGQLSEQHAAAPRCFIESFPRVILEAMAAKLPIITTPVFGIAEQVKENESALFYSPGDVSSLTRAIDRLIENPALREKLAANTALAPASLFDFDSMVNAYAEVFREAWLTDATRAASG
jgi:glycosyltransferase involved in cell wall biosynthesis